MPSNLPSPISPFRKLKDFGIGPYDSVSDASKKGEDDEEFDAPKKSLPDGGPSDNPLSNPEFLSYPQTPKVSSPSMLPGDYDLPPNEKGHWRGWRNNPTGPTTPKLPEYSDFEGNLAGPTIQRHSELPSDDQNPSSRSDYYDRLVLGLKDYISESDYWADEDSGSYSSLESLPIPRKNDVTLDNFLSSLGNFWSGYEIEDLQDSYGFPSMEYAENVNYPKSNQDDDSGGKLLAMNYDRNTRTANNTDIAGQLASDFIKKYGKKNITRRNILSYLQETGNGFRQYLASDIIRCLKLRHQIYVNDSMDTFPVAKTASTHKSSLTDIHRQLISLQISNTKNKTASDVLLKCISDVAKLMARA